MKRELTILTLFLLLISLFTLSIYFWFRFETHYCYQQLSLATPLNWRCDAVYADMVRQFTKQDVEVVEPIIKSYLTYKDNLEARKGFLMFVKDHNKNANINESILRLLFKFQEEKGFKI